MSLSNELISQFVKATNDSKKTKTETTVYGTIKEYDGSKYVQIDGSDLLTPITTTADTVPGERVTVMIKNHTATVTGNISSPAARVDDIEDVSDLIDKIAEFEIVIADKISTEEFNAEKARIDALQAEDVNIKGQLTAAEGDIDNLQASTLEVTERLTAAEADIEELRGTHITTDILDAKYATIEELNATNADVNSLESTYAAFEVATTNKLNANTADISKLQTDKLDAATADIAYAKVADLNATNADITDLESDIADINTLMFGSATGDTIHASFSNAVISQLGNAQIKSAMIDSVSADKITAGDVITNNVRVMSEDGSLIISDETMQISDDNRVRVQIGKDASGDYSINIWDVDGNLMFSKGGITDSAIKEAIIRNDMVSDTANIAAHKLDIDSLFEEINGSTKTIKSTKIYLDEEGQTLDVAFTSLSSDVSEIQNGVSSQGTAISVMQGQIASKIWQQDINSATSELSETTDTLSTQYEEMQQEVDGVKTTVADHTSTLSTKADSTAVTAVSERVTAVETDLDGFKTTVEDKFTDYSTTEQMNSAISQSATDITTIVSSTYTTKEEFAVLESVSSSVGLVEERVTITESLISQLSDSISMLVTDGDGQSLMTQTESGWTFSTAELQNIVDTTSENLDALTNEVGDIDSAVGILQQAVDDLGILNEYVKIGTYEDEPCIELGEIDSNFRLIITNTRIMFMEGTGVPAYINNQSLHIKKAVVEEELQQGEFIWKARNNGNLGLIWKGATN